VDEKQPIPAIAALADPVRRRLYDYVVDRGCAVGREEAAAGAGVPLHTARFHLERLVEHGLLEADHRRLSGRTGPGAGRPAKVYRRARATVSVSLPERGYGVVGALLATAVVRSLAGEPLGTALTDEAHRRGHEVGASYDGGGDDLTRATGALADQGFEPAREGGEVVLRNCPFDDLAREQPGLVCGLNRDFVSGALEGLGAMDLTARLDPGHDRCCVRVCRAERAG
jgi:predicted ArsR family transcriptional regulator